MNTEDSDRKLAKKAKKESRRDPESENFKESKDKKRKHVDSSDGEAVEKKEKKRKLKETMENNSDDEENYPRRRTRSISDADDKNIASLKLSVNQSAEEFRKQHQITISGFDTNGSSAFKCPDPMMSFDSTPFAQPIRTAFLNAGFSSPTPTQAQSWPIALNGRDIITVAKTGSGKTCGFLLPAFHRLLNALKERKRGPPGILVLAPTRELACQIEEEAMKFGRASNIRATCAYGGSPKSLQIRKIQAGVEILIATPGRLNDLLEMKIVNLSQVLFLVLDEADRM